MVDERGRGALALRAGDADHLLVEEFQEQVGLRGDALILDVVVDLVEADARTLENQVVLVEILVITFPFDELHVLVAREVVGVEVPIAIGDH